jgi:hypothetical protein
MMVPQQPRAAGLSFFLSYRRDDSGGHTGRLYDALSAHFGDDQVFLDIDTLPLGIDFANEIAKKVLVCDALLAIIGRNWVAATDEQRMRRLDDPGDFVRLEIEAALAGGIPVIPVLVQKARIPTSKELPDSLRPLAMRNGIELRDEAWRGDVERFIRGLSRLPPRTETGQTAPPPPAEVEADSAKAAAGQNVAPAESRDSTSRADRSKSRITPLAAKSSGATPAESARTQPGDGTNVFIWSFRVASARAPSRLFLSRPQGRFDSERDESDKFIHVTNNGLLLSSGAAGEHPLLAIQWQEIAHSNVYSAETYDWVPSGTAFVSISMNKGPSGTYVRVTPSNPVDAPKLNQMIRERMQR